MQFTSNIMNFLGVETWNILYRYTDFDLQLDIDIELCFLIYNSQVISWIFWVSLSYSVDL